MRSPAGHGQGELLNSWGARSRGAQVLGNIVGFNQH